MKQAQQQLRRAATALVPAMLSMRPAGLARQIWFWIGFAAIAAAILISTYLAADRLGHERLRQEGLHRLELYAAALESELAKYEYLPDLLTLERDVVLLLQNPRDANLVRVVNERLEGINQGNAYGRTLYPGQQGNCACVQQLERRSEFRRSRLVLSPLFPGGDASAGAAASMRSARPAAIPGFFFARALRDGERTLGVGALKVSIDHLEQTWAGSTDVVLAVDANGVIFLSSNPEWRFHTLGPLPPAAAQRIETTRQYWNVQLTPLRVEVKKVFADGARAVTVDAKPRDGNRRIWTIWN